MIKPENQIKTNIWQEIAADDNPFSARICRLRGYDVYGDLLGKASWFEFLFLLFFEDRPTQQQVVLLEGLAVALANPGPRDHSVRAAMNGGVGGSGAAASLMAALAVGAGNLGGGREVLLAMQEWREWGFDLSKWQQQLAQYPKEERHQDVWPEMEHPPGFNPYVSHCALPVRQTLDYLENFKVGEQLTWTRRNLITLEQYADCSLALSGVAAATFMDLGFNPEQGEILYLLLRLPGAAAHALEQKFKGWKTYPMWLDGVRLKEEVEEEN